MYVIRVLRESEEQVKLDLADVFWSDEARSEIVPCSYNWYQKWKLEYHLAYLISSRQESLAFENDHRRYVVSGGIVTWQDSCQHSMLCTGNLVYVFISFASNYFASVLNQAQPTLIAVVDTSSKAQNTEIFFDSWSIHGRSSWDW